jgi:hypothetical protein
MTNLNQLHQDFLDLAQRAAKEGGGGEIRQLWVRAVCRRDSDDPPS